MMVKGPDSDRASPPPSFLPSFKILTLSPESGRYFFVHDLSHIICFFIEERGSKQVIVRAEKGLG